MVLRVLLTRFLNGFNGSSKEFMRNSKFALIVELKCFLIFFNSIHNLLVLRADLFLTEFSLTVVMIMIMLMIVVMMFMVVIMVMITILCVNVHMLMIMCCLMLMLLLSIATEIELHQRREKLLIISLNQLRSFR